MSNTAIYGFLFIFSFITTTLLTRMLIPCFTALGIVDAPSARRSHNKIKPRGAGLAIVCVVMIAFCIFEFLTTKTICIATKLLPILFAISTISFLDDIRPIPVLIRLVVHLICSGLVVYIFLPFALFNHTNLVMYLVFAAYTVALTGFINAYNFMDGIDGISAVQSIHLSITMLILCYLQFPEINNPHVIIALNVILLGCCIGFLIFNWHPAKIFLGDTGSISLGFLMGFCLLVLASTNADLCISCFIACLYYLTDSGVTILVRLFNKEKIWLPHSKHFFQKAVQRGKSHSHVAKQIAICNLFLMTFSIFAFYYPITSIILSIFTVIVTIMTLLR